MISGHFLCLILCAQSIEEGGTYCFAHVCQYVSIPQTCATYNWKTLNTMYFKLDTLINIIYEDDPYC